MTAMPARLSAGIAVLRVVDPDVQLLIGHMGGPFWAAKDEAAWSVPKGAVEADESVLQAAQREFAEETGLKVPAGPTSDLGSVRANGKEVRLWAVWADIELSGFTPGVFELAWPPRSARTISVPELDRVRWSTLAQASTLLVRSQRPFLPRLAALPRPA